MAWSDRQKRVDGAGCDIGYAGFFYPGCGANRTSKSITRSTSVYSNAVFDRARAPYGLRVWLAAFNFGSGWFALSLRSGLVALGMAYGGGTAWMGVDARWPKFVRGGLASNFTRPRIVARWLTSHATLYSYGRLLLLCVFL